jgi:membrane-bound ClpP family serine protease
MTKKISAIILLLLFTGISIQGFAYNTKKAKRNITDDCTENIEDGSDVKLPLGLPFSINDASGSSGTSSDENSNDSKIVYTFDLPDGQGPESYHETHSAFAQARSMNASCVLIRMNSMSGALDAAANLSNEMSDYDRPVMVYVNDKAIPASTLISMAADNKKNKQSVANTKETKRPVAAKHKITASKSADPKQAARDEISCISEIPSLPLEKQFTADANGDLDAVLTQAGLNNYTVVHYSPGFFAQLLDWCMKPWVSLLLVILIALGLRLQVNSVFPGPATFLLLVSLPLFGIPLFVGGLAGAGEFGLALFMAITVVITTRKKTSSTFLRVAAMLGLIVVMTLCQSQAFGPASDWKMPAMVFLLSTLTFTVGWMLPAFIGKFRRASSTTLAQA